MAKEYSVAVIGTLEAILGFGALGADVFDAKSSTEVVEKITELKKGEKKYAVVFVTEDLMKNVTEEEYEKLSRDALPAIVAIPSTSGSTGYSLKRIQAIMRKAIGSDVLV